MLGHGREYTADLMVAPGAADLNATTLNKIRETHKREDRWYFCMEMSSNWGFLTITDLCRLRQSCRLGEELVRSSRIIEWDNTNDNSISDCTFASLPFKLVLKINLRRCTFVHHGLWKLTENLHLRELSVVDCPNIDDGLLNLVLPTMPLLQKLNISGSSATSASCLNIASSCKFIKSLQIARCEGVSSLTEALNIGLTQLNELDISECCIEDAGLVHLSNCKLLQHLSLGNLGIGDATVCVEVLKLSQLRELDVAYTCISDASLFKIAQNLSNIQVLNVNGCRITDSGLSQIARHGEKLKSLCIAFCPNLLRWSLVAIAMYCCNLRTLCMTGSRCSPQHALLLLSLRAPTLQHLFVSNCRWFGDLALTALALGCSSELTRVELYGTSISDVDAFSVLLQRASSLNSLAGPPHVIAHPTVRELWSQTPTMGNRIMIVDIEDCALGHDLSDEDSDTSSSNGYDDDVTEDQYTLSPSCAEIIPFALPTGLGPLPLSRLQKNMIGVQLSIAKIFKSRIVSAYTGLALLRLLSTERQPLLRSAQMNVQV